MPRPLFSFVIDPELLDGLRKVQARDGASLAEQIRRALRLWLAKKRIRVASIDSRIEPPLDSTPPRRKKTKRAPRRRTFDPARTQWPARKAR